MTDQLLAGSDFRVADLFTTQSTDTPWEWAKARRQWFKTPGKDLAGGAFVGIVGFIVRYASGNVNWVRSTVEALVIAVAGALVLPTLEASFWLARRRSILLDEREKRLDERETAPLATLPDSVANSPDRPRAEVTFDCDQTGWARLRTTNAGAGANFSATIQLFGITAGAVEGMQITGKWDLVDGPVQRIAHADTRVMRLASVIEIARGVRAWAIHRAGGADIRSVNLVEFMEVRLVAEPDLVEPCNLQIILNADGGSKMARVGVDPPLFHVVPPRVDAMRRLLAEVADYVRAMPQSTKTAKPAVWMAAMVHDHVSELLGQAFGPPVIAVYQRQLKEGDGSDLRERCAAFLLDLGQRLTEDDILPSFPMPITWVEFYERQPGWEWPEYD